MMDDVKDKLVLTEGHMNTIEAALRGEIGHLFDTIAVLARHIGFIIDEDGDFDVDHARTDKPRLDGFVVEYDPITIGDDEKVVDGE